MPKSSNAAIGFIFITLLIDVIGLGLIIPVMPEIIAQMKKLPVNEASVWGGYLIVAYALTQFVFAPVLGGLSDRYGRRPVLLLSLFGFFVDYIILALAPNFTWFFIARVISGITGASFTAAAAYIADISTNETRAKNFGMIGAAFGLGFIIGPALGGLLGGLGLRAPFYAAALLCLFNFLYGYFILPESLKSENRRPFTWKRANPLGALLQLKKYPQLKWIVMAFVLMQLAAHAVQSNWSFFVKYMFQWKEATIGISLAVVGALVFLVQGVLIRKTHPRLGDEKSVYAGLLLYALGLTLFAFASQTWMMFVFLIPYCLGGISGPSMQSIVAKAVAPNQQGEVQGVLTSIMSLTAIAGPWMMTHIFEAATKAEGTFHFPGAPFLLGALLMLGSGLVAYRGFKRA